MQRYLQGLIFCLLFWSAQVAVSHASERVMIFAAASTTDAVGEAAAMFKKQTGIEIVASFAGSAVIAKQVVAGAPADIFLSANIRWMDYAEENSGIVPQSRRNLLSNRLVLIAPKDGKTIALETLPTDLDDNRLAIGDPDHVPAGIYGKKALEALNLWDSVKGKLARMANVRSALTLVERGEAAAGIVYQTDAPIAQQTKIVATFPAESHPPILYPIALTPAGANNPAAQKFLHFLTGEQARAIFARYGFSSAQPP